MLCSLLSDVNEVLRDKILHRLMLIQYHAMIFLHDFILFYICFFLSPILKKTAYHKYECKLKHARLCKENKLEEKMIPIETILQLKVQLYNT